MISTCLRYWLGAAIASTASLLLATPAYGEPSGQDWVEQIPPSSSNRLPELVRTSHPIPAYLEIQPPASDQSRTRFQGKVYLDDVKIETVTDGDQSSYWLQGKLTNRSDGKVFKIRVHYKIKDGFQILDAGNFTIDQPVLLSPEDQVRFQVAVKANGKLDIAFVEWKYEDGTQGTSQRGTF